MATNNYKISSSLNPSKVFILQKSQLENRLDPLFYVSNIFGFLKITSHKVKSIREVTDYTISGFGVGREEQDLTEKGFIQIRPTNLDEFGNLKFNRNIYLGNEYLETKKSNIIKKNDILFNNTNSQELVGKTAFFNLEGIYFHSNHITRIRVNENILRPKFLYILLNLYQERKIFYTLCTNWNNQSGVGIELLNSIKIIIPSFEIQDKVIALKEKSLIQKQKNEAEAEKLLASIDDYLLKELGIKLPATPKNTLKNRMFTSSLKEISGNRFDPNYHTKYFKELFKSFKNGKYEYSQIRKYASFQAGFAFKSTDYLEQSQCLLITIKNIRQNKIDINDATFLPNDFYEQFKDFQIKENDLLIAMTGATIGKVGIYNHPQKALLNQRNGIIKPDRINSIYLMSLLNLSVFQDIILRNSNGGAQPNISETDIMRISIPVPPLIKQKEIAEHITNIRLQAQQLKDKTKEALKKASAEIEAILIGS